MNQIRSVRHLFGTADLLIINILSICFCVNSVGEDEILSVVSCEELHMSAASPPVTSSVIWQGGNCCLCETRKRSGGVAGMTKRGRLRETERHAVYRWFPPAQKELSFTRVKIKFTIGMKQTSIGYSARRYLPIALFDRNRDSYTTALSFSL